MKTAQLIQRCALLGALAGGATPDAQAADPLVTVTETGGEYKLRVVAVLNAPEDYVYRVITDYRHADRINPAITSIEILPAEREGVIRVKNRSTHRVGLFSFEIEWVGDISETAPGRVDIATVPELSSFDSGSAVWKMRPDGERTSVRYESRLKPKFYILPVLGKHLVKKHVADEARNCFDRIEHYARSLLEQETPEDRPDLKIVLSGNRPR